jgi:hypothetical protein
LKGSGELCTQRTIALSSAAWSQHCTNEEDGGGEDEVVEGEEDGGKLLLLLLLLLPGSLV